MTKANLKKLYQHFSKLAEEGGKTNNEVRNKLIKEDAKKNKEDIEKKHPEIVKEIKETSQSSTKKDNSKSKSKGN